uniref:Astacin domain-containing protein n=1 Tax=Meloidogyne hapla TaxID=6305 RepID=A0A1I8AXP8_MELHA
GCLQTSHKRPTMHAIVKFLDGNCDYFKYEGKIGDNRCD